MEESVIRTYSPGTFAFLGDAVYSLCIREYLARKANCQPDKLHRKSVRFVSATAQAKAVTALLPELSEEEKDIYRRGKNAHTQYTAKNATKKEYHEATGFEALLGWLYLLERHERIDELVEKAIEINEG
ncbi:MAG: ribonuclease III [Lachnospiraceae bacterium]|nr:ribonuclease III [Lachnospiraceae bacterium]